MKFVGEGNQVAVWKDYRHQIATGEPIEYLLTESLAADFAPGIYKLRLELSGKGATLTAERPVEVFARKPVKLGMVPPVWVWEKGTVLQEWLRQRGVEAKQGSAAQVRPGDLVLVSELPVEGDSIADIQAAVRRGARGIILRPEIVLDGGEKPKADAPFDRTYSELLEPVSGNWKPKLVEISWWGNPGAWGYSRTALALMSPYLKGLPQAVALEAQPAYQRVAPKYTWRLDGRPESVPVGRAVVESSLNVDTAYTSDLFSMPFGEGVLVLSTLHLAEYLSADPAADRILENIVEYRK